MGPTVDNSSYRKRIARLTRLIANPVLFFRFYIKTSCVSPGISDISIVASYSPPDLWLQKRLKDNRSVKSLDTRIECAPLHVAELRGFRMDLFVSSARRLYI